MKLPWQASPRPAPRLFVAVFEHEHDLLAAAAAARADGYVVHDAWAPHAIHGLDNAMGIQPSRLPWICFGAGAIGLLGALFFEHWTSAVDWAIDVGGKPPSSLAAFLPVAINVMILIAANAVVSGLFALHRLGPGRQARPPVARVTDDRYALALDVAAPRFLPGQARGLMRACHAIDIFTWEAGS
ncbi:MAG TPA: DUF3341 domain-containing protein [Polyangia bacterium]|nr:DUF3341 domain-containing protein [Polyangia bacterium]